MHGHFHSAQDEDKSSIIEQHAKNTISKNLKQLFRLAILILSLVFVFTFVIIRPENLNNINNRFLIGEVLEVSEKVFLDESTYSQEMLVKVEPNILETVVEATLANNLDQDYHKGDFVIITENQAKNINSESNKDKYIFVERFRIQRFVIVFVILLFLIILLAGKQGFLAIIAMFLSGLFILGYFIPNLLTVNNPVTFTLISSIFISALAIFLSQGISKRTVIAFSSIVITILVTTFISIAMVNWLDLAVMNEETETIAIFGDNQIINFRGLLLAGMVIGLIGVLDDVTISQATIVEQFKKVKQNMTDLELFQRTMIIGQAHMISTINTLVLAYTSATLPILIVLIHFSPDNFPFWLQINNANILEEIIRMIVGTFGLLLAVPITTWMSIKFLKVSPQKSKNSELSDDHKHLNTGFADHKE